MIRLPPRSTRTDTLFPYTTPFRSSELLMGHLATAEADHDLDLVALVKKARDRAELGLVIAIFRRWTEFDFLDLDLLLLFLRSVRGLVLLIKVLAVIHDLEDRRFRVWRNLNQIETFFLSLGLGIK